MSKELYIIRQIHHRITNLAKTTGAHTVRVVGDFERIALFRNFLQRYPYMSEVNFQQGGQIKNADYLKNPNEFLFNLGYDYKLEVSVSLDLFISGMPQNAQTRLKEELTL